MRLLRLGRGHHDHHKEVTAISDHASSITAVRDEPPFEPNHRKPFGMVDDTQQNKAGIAENPTHTTISEEHSEKKTKEIEGRTKGAESAPREAFVHLGKAASLSDRVEYGDVVIIGSVREGERPCRSYPTIILESHTPIRSSLQLPFPRHQLFLPSLIQGEAWNAS